ncbi:hypothetical protein [Porticoccus sp.]
MSLMKLFGVSILVAGLTACGGSETGGKEEAAEAAAPAASHEMAPQEAMEAVVEEATAVVEETKEAVAEAVEEAKKAAPEPEKLEIPEGMVEGSVEHSIWLNNQGQ